ncbi:MAG: MmgE/PrpD family protein [Pseudomonadota bacterium]
MTELRELARWIVMLDEKNVPEAALTEADLCVLDTMGAAIGGYEHPLLEQVAETYLGIAGQNKSSSLWGRNRQTSLQTAIFLNAMAAHMLELDDVHTRSKTHIGTVVIPAAWGMAEYLQSSGREFLMAVLAGYEAEARIGMAMGVSSHRNRGWHATSTAGTFGAAAACGKLLGLDEDQMVSALGMAGTQSFGLWAFLGDGASSKGLHPARAAVSGCEAALLAKSGMTGPEHILTAEDGGLLAAVSDEYDVRKVCAGLGREWEILAVDKKPYPCCRSAHCAIDAAIALRSRGKIVIEEIESIKVDTYAVGYKQCGMSAGCRSPKNPLEAKFSTPYAVAVALLDGVINLSSFDEVHVNNESVRKLLQLVEVRADEAFTLRYPEHWGCRLTICNKDGSMLTEEIPDASGSVQNPLNIEQTKEKAWGLMHSIPEKERREAIARILEIAQAASMPHIFD